MLKIMKHQGLIPLPPNVIMMLIFPQFNRLDKPPNGIAAHTVHIQLQSRVILIIMEMVFKKKLPLSQFYVPRNVYVLEQLAIATSCSFEQKITQTY